MIAISILQTKHAVLILFASFSGNVRKYPPLLVGLLLLCLLIWRETHSVCNVISARRLLGSILATAGRADPMPIFCTSYCPFLDCIKIAYFVNGLALVTGRSQLHQGRSLPRHIVDSIVLSGTPANDHDAGTYCPAARSCRSRWLHRHRVCFASPVEGRPSGGLLWLPPDESVCM